MSSCSRPLFRFVARVPLRSSSAYLRPVYSHRHHLTSNATGSIRTIVTATPYERQNTAPTMMSAARKKALLYRSRQRGWLELDLIMGTWAEKHIHKLSEEELLDYESIVRCENPDLIKWLVERTQLPAELDTPIMRSLIEYTHGDGKQWIREAGGNQ